ncbi:uncharacterized protein [Blastocystis hominis]|uniref:G-patch domain-containing protein n=1 Tax=Blastocystis hominis TaxID=12968 RepID=D8LY95_BLAHO|nr:uncharacterized protein [Blastocystis hominis]CBK20550.2 unnamed protein product [Blastocystis hominis]|eukprot:XP_012894598.1 uncharacterized protein [Blastocystis hominis]
MSDFSQFTKKDEPEKEKTAAYTTGFGVELMRKMGFEGRLGKDGQGISNPIATKKRPEGLGLGANGFKEASTLKANKEIAKIYNKVCYIVAL